MNEVFHILDEDTVKARITDHDPTKVIVRWTDKLQFVRYRHTLEYQLFKHPKYAQVNTILHCIRNELIEHTEREEE